MYEDCKKGVSDNAKQKIPRRISYIFALYSLAAQEDTSKVTAVFRDAFLGGNKKFKLAYPQETQFIASA
jgi:hypothetical protein